MMRIALGIPAYSGQIAVETADGLLQSRDLFDSVIWVKSCCFPSRARNIIADKFLRGRWDKLLFIDSDIVFYRQNVEMLLRHDRDVVAGIYTARGIDDHRVFVSPKGERIDRGLNEVNAVATGFMLIKREVFEAIRDNRPDDWSWSGDNKETKLHDFFPSGRCVEQHDWTTDDFSFCHLAREAGKSIWADADIIVGHLGTVVFGIK